jgi:hypothetical protein
MVSDQREQLSGGDMEKDSRDLLPPNFPEGRKDTAKNVKEFFQSPFQSMYRKPPKYEAELPIATMLSSFH